MKQCVAPMLCKNFLARNFRRTLSQNEVPTKKRDCEKLFMIVAAFGFPLQKFSRKKLSKNAFERTKFQRKSANAVNLP